MKGKKSSNNDTRGLWLRPCAEIKLNQQHAICGNTKKGSIQVLRKHANGGKKLILKLNRHHAFLPTQGRGAIMLFYGNTKKGSIQVLHKLMLNGLN